MGARNPDWTTVRDSLQLRRLHETADRVPWLNSQNLRGRQASPDVLGREALSPGQRKEKYHSQSRWIREGRAFSFSNGRLPARVFERHSKRPLRVFPIDSSNFTWLYGASSRRPGNGSQGSDQRGTAGHRAYLE